VLLGARIQLFDRRMDGAIIIIIIARRVRKGNSQNEGKKINEILLFLSLSSWQMDEEQRPHDFFFLVWRYAFSWKRGCSFGKCTLSKALTENKEQVQGGCAICWHVPKKQERKKKFKKGQQSCPLLLFLGPFFFFLFSYLLSCLCFVFFKNSGSSRVN
jgi:hypothetical protein